MGHHFFISYSSSDIERVEQICALLKEEKATYWLAREHIRPGEEHARAIPRAIRNSRVVLVAFSKTADRSRHISRELTLADDYGKKIIPVRLEKYEPKNLKYYLKTAQWVEFHGISADGGTQQLRDLAANVRGPLRQPAQPTVTGEAPGIDNKTRSVDGPATTESAGVLSPAKSKRLAADTSAPAASASEPAISERRSHATVRKAKTTTVTKPAEKPLSGAGKAVIRRRALPKDPDSAFLAFEERSREDKAAAAEIMWARGVACCNRKKPDFQMARQWFERAGALEERDFREARRLFTAAANAGNVEAMINLAVYDETGVAGPQDFDRAKAWLQKAADRGSVDAMCRLGILFINGNLPKVSPNYKMAEIWIRRAADRGHAEAMYRMGKLFARRNDKQNADMWYRDAAARGHAQAKYELT